MTPHVARAEDVGNRIRTDSLSTIFGPTDIEAERVGEGEAVGSSLNSVVSGPLRIPDSCCIAVKVISDCSDRMLKADGVKTCAR
jgi:hypothetical protein